MQVGWVIDGKRYSHKKMMDYAATYPQGFAWPPEVLDKMFRYTERDYPSPTTLQGCPRAHVLKVQTPYYVEPEKAWAACMGTFVHEGIEQATAAMKKRGYEPYAVTEQHLVCQFIRRDGTEITLEGTVDKVLLVPELNLLVDYKTVPELMTDTTQKGRAKIAGWTAQLSCYRWMLHQHNIEIERAVIQQICRGGVSKTEIDLWDLERTQMYLESRLTRWDGVFEGAFDVSANILPAPIDSVVEDDKYWLCNIWCEVKDICKRKIEEGV